MARLNEDGSVDTSFVPPLLDGNISSIQVRPDTRILIVGAFDEVAGVARSGLARLNTDASLDATFNPIIGGGAVSALLILPDGRILLGGNFTSVNGVRINGIARLNPDGINPSTPQFLGIQLYAGMLLNGTLTNTYRIEYTPNLNTQALWTPIATLTLPTNPFLFLDTNSPANASRFYRMMTVQ
jgi:uncharacterized delta-60 repeat protein